MRERIISYLVLATALGSGLVAGVFFAFSTFVMPALSRIAPEKGIAAMQAINVSVLDSGFMAVFVATGAGSLALTIVAASGWARPDALLLLSAGASYCLGVFLLTLVCNVPRNDALAAVDAASEHGAAVWGAYLQSWTAWNHVRTVAALASAVLFTFAFRNAPLAPP